MHVSVYFYHYLKLTKSAYPACVLCSQDYFGVCTEAAIKDNVVVVYELLEEMLDNGFPLATESNILKELIKPPTILRTMVNTITGLSVFYLCCFLCCLKSGSNALFIHS